MNAHLSYRNFRSGTKVTSLTEYDSDFGEHGSYSELKGWSVLRSQPNTKTGFSALAIRNGNDIIISYRGSNTDEDNCFDDWISTNLASAFFVFNQQEPEMMDFISELMIEYPNTNIYVSGHTLGGNCLYGRSIWYDGRYKPNKATDCL